jgi:transposase-like protein
MHFRDAYTSSKGKTADDFFDDSEPLNIPFPQVKSWDLVGPIKTFTFFDLSGAEYFDYACVGPSDGFLTEYLPTQAKKMFLREVDFPITALSQHGGHLMPNLTTLLLFRSKIEGPLYRYLSFPQLKTLCLHVVSFYYPDENTLQDSWSHRKRLSLSDVLSFQNTPELEHLNLAWMPIDGKFADRIQHCPKLQEFEADFCELEGFIPSLTKSLADGNAFPSLQRLRFLWPFNGLDKTSKKEFSSYCATQRPEIVVSYTDQEASNLLLSIYKT